MRLPAVPAPHPYVTLAAPGGQAVYAVTFGPRGDLLAAADGNGQA
jgi:hypothetical protein